MKPPQLDDARLARLQEELEDIRVEFAPIDVAQMVIGALALGIPIALTEEVWVLSTELPWAHAALIVLASLAVISVFVYIVYYNGVAQAHAGQFVGRVTSAYGIALVVSASILALFNKLPLFSDPDTALTRIIIVAFPACFAATVADTLNQ